MGVANKHSIAWAIAEAFHAAGAELAFSYQNERFGAKVGRLTGEAMPGALLLPCDVSSDEDLDQLAMNLRERWGRLDGFVHSIAYARKEELGGLFADTSRQGFALAHDISAYSLVGTAQRLRHLMTGGGSIITLTFQGSQRVMPNYNVMGVAKASLEASMRYLASDLGPAHIRVNALSPGPIRTVSAKGVSDFNRLLEGMAEKTPMRRLASAADVAGAALFLAADLSAAVTGTVLYCDCGYHITGA